MVTFKPRTVLSVLENKLHAERIESKHIKFKIYDDDGILVGITEVSRGWNELDDNLMKRVASPLHVSTGFWVDVCRCKYGRQEYLDRVQQ